MNKLITYLKAFKINLLKCIMIKNSNFNQWFINTWANAVNFKNIITPLNFISRKRQRKHQNQVIKIAKNMFKLNCLHALFVKV